MNETENRGRNCEGRATWWVYGTPGDTTSRIRHSASMRGQWGYDVTCSCGWDSRTGGALRRYVADILDDHRRGLR
jgi:hypothetical protein